MGVPPSLGAVASKRQQEVNGKNHKKAGDRFHRASAKRK